MEFNLYVIDPVLDPSSKFQFFHFRKIFHVGLFIAAEVDSASVDVFPFLCGRVGSFFFPNLEF